MSKCHPDKRKLKRRLLNEHKKEVVMLQRTIQDKNHQLSGYYEKTDSLLKEIEEKRVIIREIGDNHGLKYDKPSDDGTLVSFTRVNAVDIEVRAAGKTKDAIEDQLVHQIALGLMKKNLVVQNQSQTQQLELTEALYGEIGNIETTVKQVIDKINS